MKKAFVKTQVVRDDAIPTYRVRSSVEPVQLATQAPVKKALGHKRKSKGRKAQKQLVYTDKSGQVKACRQGAPAQVVAVLKPVKQAEPRPAAAPSPVSKRRRMPGGRGMPRITPPMPRLR